MRNLLLKKKVGQKERRRILQSTILIAPSLVFLLLAFLLPIGTFFYYSVANQEIPATLPNTVRALAQWDGEGVPGEPAFDAMVTDIRAADRRDVAILARRLNYQHAGNRTLILKTARSLAKPTTADTAAQALSRIDSRWSQPDIWLTLKRESGSVTSFYLLSALDLEIDPEGSLRQTPEARAIYGDVLARTFWMSLVITLTCLVLGYPVAFLLSTVRKGLRNWLLLFVLLPFWTSLLVRTLAWMVLFQKNGIVNDLLVFLQLTAQPIQLINTRMAVYVGMIHILLPFMILPLYSVMVGISPSYYKAAVSLGAHPFRAFWTVYVPQTLPGIGAGMLLVSILALGFYITPELLGAPADQMVSYFVAFYTNQSVNWGMAAALGVWLLMFALILFALLNRFVGFNRMRLR